LCDDNNPCTSNDRCNNGTCVGQLDASCVPCQNDTGCSTFPAGACQEAYCSTAGICGVRIQPNCVPCQNDTNCSGVTVGPCQEAYCTDAGVCGLRTQEDCVPCQNDTDCSGVSVDQCHGAVCGAGGVCIVVNNDAAACEDGNACTVGDTCQSGFCTPGAVKICAAPATCKATGVCTNTTTGECSYADLPNNTACGSGQICCEGSCVGNNTSTNCGRCGVACTGINKGCQGGQCICTNICSNRFASPNPETCVCECPVGTTECNNFGTMTCVNLQTAEHHCGACGHQCSNTEQCVAGICVAACPPGTSPACSCGSSNLPGESVITCCPPHPGGCPEGTEPRRGCSGCGFNCACTCTYQCCIPGTGTCSPL
jgi:hypothetical protein